MDFEQDYIKRMIKGLAKMLAKILFNKTQIEYELPEDGEYTSTDVLYDRIIELADSGEINEAENILLDEIDTEDNDQMEMAFAFYFHINKFDDNFLEAHDYSRDEIVDGIHAIADLYGVSNIVDSLL